MAHSEHSLVDGVIRSIDKKIEWELLPAQNETVRLQLRRAHSQASIDISHSELIAALEGGVPRNRLRERIKRVRRRLYESAPPYMPWRLPKIEAIGAPQRSFGPRPTGRRY